MTEKQQQRALEDADALADLLRSMTPYERFCTANDPDYGSVGVRIVALTLVEDRAA